MRGRTTAVRDRAAGVTVMTLPTAQDFRLTLRQGRADAPLFNSTRAPMRIDWHESVHGAFTPPWPHPIVGTVRPAVELNRASARPCRSVNAESCAVGSVHHVTPASPPSGTACRPAAHRSTGSRERDGDRLPHRSCRGPVIFDDCRSHTTRLPIRR